MTIQAMFETIAEVGFFNYFISFYREFPLTITVFCILSFALGAGVAFLVLRLYPGRRKTPDQDRIRDQERPSKPKQTPSISGQSPPPGSRDRLDTPINFDAIDDQPVDLIFLLLAPESAGADHLKALARVSRLLRDKSECEKLRGTDGAEALYALLTQSEARAA